MMLSCTSEELAARGGAELIVAGGRIEGDIVIDSREAAPGAVFVAFKGENTDGNIYAASALEAGAAAVVLSDEAAPELAALAREKGAALLRAPGDDCEEFLLRLAKARRDEHPEWLVVGVTGSVGKTTTKELVAAGLSTFSRVHATAGNYNSLIGLPLTVLAAPADAETIVLEMGMNHADEIRRMSSCARPALACITNVGTAHIGFLGSREGIARAKAEMVEGMEAHGDIGPALVLPSSCDYEPLVRAEAEACGVRLVTVGAHECDMLGARDVVLGDDGKPYLSLAYADGGRISCTPAIPGRAVVFDLELAAAVCELAGADREAAIRAMEQVKGGSMRMNVDVSASGVRIIDDSYNASPASMAAALDVLSEMACAGKRVAVLGEMGEMGDEAAHMHALVGAYAAAKELDLIVVVGDELAGEMVSAALALGYSNDALVRAASVDELISFMRDALDPGDVVLVKGSRAAGLDVFAKEARSW